MSTDVRTDRPAIVLDNEGKCSISLVDLFGNSVDILGLKRSGKTTTGFVLMEGWLHANLPLTFVDPHNEGWGLKIAAATGRSSGYQVVVAGRGKRADVPLNVEHAADLATFSYTNRIPVVLSLFRMENAERFAILKAYFEQLWVLAEQSYDEENVQNYGIFLEEAPTYLPQGESTLVKDILKKIVQEGGKFGFATFLVTQRSQDIDKKVLSQGALYLLHQVIHPRDKEIYAGLIPEPHTRVEQRIADLGQGDAILVHNKTVQVLHIRQQRTYHVGVTPGMQQPPIHPVSALDTTILEQLRAIMTQDPPVDPLRQQIAHLEQYVCDLQATLQQRVEAYETSIATKEAEMQGLRTQLDVLRNLALTISGTSVVGTDTAPSVLHLEALSTHVESAIIEVQRLLNASPEWDGDIAYLHPTVLDAVRTMATSQTSIQALQRELQEVRADSQTAQEQLRIAKAELKRLRSTQPAGSGVSGAQRDVIDTLSEQERATWQFLLRTFVGLKGTEGSIAKLLFLHDGRGLTSAEIAGMLHKAPNTVNQNIPVTLVDQGIVQVRRRGNANIYSGNLLSYLQSTFPGKEKALQTHLFVLL